MTLEISKFKKIYFSIKFKNDANLQATGDALRNLLLNEQECLPVRVEAAIALNQFICQQNKIADYMKQYLRDIVKGISSNTFIKY